MDRDISEIDMSDRTNIPLSMQKQHFVVRYLREHFSTSAVDQLFHELWRDKFGGAYKSANWGAEMSYGAMRQLKRMYDRNMLERGVVRLGTN